MKNLKNILFVFIVIGLQNCTNLISYQMTRPINTATMHNETINDLTLFYYTLGNQDNPPIVFLHGILAFTEAYKKILLSLSKQYFVIGIDLPGHGRSTISSYPYDINNISQDVIRLTEKLGLNQFYLVGHSMGGLITLSICEQFPNRVIKGVSIASLYNVEGIEFNNNKYNFLSENGFRKNNNRNKNYILKIFNHAYYRLDEEEKFSKTKDILESYKKDLYPQFTVSQVQSIETPILIVVAEKDRLIKPEHTKSMAKLLKNGTLLSLPNANHGSVLSSKRNIKILTNSIYSFFRS